MGKYKNKKTTVNGIIFDSKKEADRYVYLLKQQQNGEIHELDVHVRFEIIPKIGKEKPCNYYADFTYLDKDNKLIVEDVKGSKQTMTAVYKIKRKLMRQVYGVEIHEIL